MADDPCAKLPKILYDLAKASAEHPDVRDMDDVVARVSEGSDIPVTRAEVVEAVVTEGRGRKAKKEGDLKDKITKFGEIKREGKREESLLKQTKNWLDILSGKQKASPEKRAAATNGTIRNLEIQLRETKDKAMQKQARAQIESLEKQLGVGDFSFDPKKPSSASPDLQALRKERAGLASEKQQGAALEKRLADIERQVASGQLDPKKAGNQNLARPSIAKLQGKIAEARKSLGRLKRIEDLKAGTESLLTDLKAMKAEDFAAKYAPKPRPRKYEGDKTIETLEFERWQAKQKALDVIREVEQSGGIRKALRWAARGSIAWKLGGDLGAFMRQGITAAGNPRRFLRSAFNQDTLRALASPKGEFDAMKKIQESPHFLQMQRNNPHLISGLADSLSSGEEGVLAKVFGHIPLVGGGLARAQRVFLNLLRSDLYDGLVEGFAPNGIASNEQSKRFGQLVGDLTGRGHLGKFEANAEALADFALAPRFYASSWNLVTFDPIRREFGLSLGSGKNRPDPITLRAAIGQYGRMLTGLSTIAIMYAMAGAQLESDVRSSDFGTAGFGPLRQDFTGGRAKWLSLIAKLTTGKTKTRDGEIVDTRVGDALWNFGKNRTAPGVREAANYLSGKMPDGTPWTLGAQVKDTLKPWLAGQDALRIWETDLGIEKKTALTLLNFLGASTYNTEKKKPAPARQPFNIGQR